MKVRILVTGVLCIRYALLFSRALNQVVYGCRCDGEV